MEDDKVEKIRLNNSLQDLLELNSNQYCDLGAGYGEIPIGLKHANKKVIVVESVWNEYLIQKWGNENSIKYYIKDFFLDDFSFFAEDVDCFILTHCIAHFHLPPQVLFEKIYNKLPKGGFFYLSTVNACSLSRVLSLYRGLPITGKVYKEHQNHNITNVYLQKMLGITRQMTYSEWMHVKEYTKPELEEMLISEKFKIFKSFYRNNFNNWKQKLVSKIKPHLSEEIVIIAQKQ